METYIKIGKSIISKLADYTNKVTLDDESEYFPILKIIINGVVETHKDSEEKETIRTELINYAKELYVSSWLRCAKEDEENPNIEKETNDAIKQFNNIYDS